jgi:hypothetical protein
MPESTSMLRTPPQHQHSTRARCCCCMPRWTLLLHYSTMIQQQQQRRRRRRYRYRVLLHVLLYHKKCGPKINYKTNHTLGLLSCCWLFFLYRYCMHSYPHLPAHAAPPPPWIQLVHPLAHPLHFGKQPLPPPYLRQVAQALLQADGAGPGEVQLFQSNGIRFLIFCCSGHSATGSRTQLSTTFAVLGAAPPKPPPPAVPRPRLPRCGTRSRASPPRASPRRSH